MFFSIDAIGIRQKIWFPQSNEMQNRNQSRKIGCSKIDNNGLMARQVRRVSEVNSKEMTEVLTKGDIPEETLEELSEFGSIMISEVLQRVPNVDTKLISILALSAAMMGFDLLSSEILPKAGAASRPTRYALLLAVALAIWSLISCYRGLRIIISQWPSGRDWFVVSRFAAPVDLTKTHLLALLAAHQANERVCGEKAKHARHAQNALIASALVVGAICIVRTLAV